jgi:transposase
MRARNRLSKLLLRRGIRYQGKGKPWSEPHRVWLARLELGEAAARATLQDYRGAIEALLHRRAELERQIEAMIPGSDWEREVGLLRCLRGIDTLSAVGLTAEIGDFRRFKHAAQLMHYVGLVPSESSTGEQRRLGSITKTGSRHARRLLVEAAWHYRHRPYVAKPLTERQAGQPVAAVATSWSAQRRLNRTWTRPRAKGKRPVVVAVAAARELTGFCWAIATVED